MEIKTCEEYVLAELEETKENLLKVGESNIKLKEENEKIINDIKYLLSFIELKDFSCGNCYRFDVDEKNYYDELTDEFKIVSRIIEEYK